jgi:hypothetical protein
MKSQIKDLYPVIINSRATNRKACKYIIQNVNETISKRKSAWAFVSLLLQGGGQNMCSNWHINSNDILKRKQNPTNVQKAYRRVLKKDKDTFFINTFQTFNGLEKRHIKDFNPFLLFRRLQKRNACRICFHNVHGKMYNTIAFLHPLSLHFREQLRNTYTPTDMTLMALSVPKTQQTYMTSNKEPWSDTSKTIIIGTS